MSKLFALEEIKEDLTGIPPRKKNDSDEPKITDIDTDDYVQDLEMIMEAFKTASNDLKLVGTMAATLNSKKPASVAYFASLESLTPFVQNIADNLGMKGKIPSLETFQSPMAFDACHDVALEGFFDYIKKIWEKIRSFFVAFFKKMMLFFKRAFNASLELDEYEQYLDDLIARIRRDKAEISDNKAKVTSRLPSVIANPGMEEVNAEFVVTHGRNKLNKLTQAINDVYVTRLLSHGKKGMGVVSEQIEDFIDTIKKPEISLEELIGEAGKIEALIDEVMSGVLPNLVGKDDRLPESVYNDIQHQFTRAELDDLKDKGRCMFEPEDLSGSLPKNFNAYYFYLPASKVYLTSTVEEVQNVSDQLGAITTRERLFDFYDFYKKYSKAISYKQLDRSLDEVSDDIDDIVSVMHKKYADTLENIYRKKPQSSGIRTVEQAFDAIFKHSKELDEQINKAEAGEPYVRKMNEFKTMRSVIAGAVNATGHAEESYLYNEGNEAAARNLIRGKEEEYIKAVNSIVNQEGGDSSMNADDQKEKLKVLEDLQKFILNFLTTFQVFLKEAANNLVGVYQQARYDMAKYIYDTCKLYGV